MDGHVENIMPPVVQIMVGGGKKMNRSVIYESNIWYYENCFWIKENRSKRLQPPIVAK